MHPGHKSSVSGRSYSQYGQDVVGSSASSTLPPDFLQRIARFDEINHSGYFITIRYDQGWRQGGGRAPPKQHKVGVFYSDLGYFCRALGYSFLVVPLQNQLKCTDFPLASCLAMTIVLKVLFKYEAIDEYIGAISQYCDACPIQ